MQEDFESYSDENELLDIENYALPEQKEVVLDLSKNTIQDVKNLTPLEMIILTAKDQKIELKEFDLSKGYLDTGCRKKGCWGRGYKGFEGHIPIPCSCIFKEKPEDPRATLNRAGTRAYNRQGYREVQAIKTKRAKAMNLRNVGNGFWKSKNGVDFIWTKKGENTGFYRYSKVEKDFEG